MSQSSETSRGDNKNSNDSNVIQLGFNISVAGKSTSDFEIYVNDKKQACGQLSAPHLKQISLSSDQSLQEVGSNYESQRGEFAGGSYHDKNLVIEDVNVDIQKNERTPSSLETEDKRSRNEDLTIVDEIKSAMGNFERLSEHVREIPRLSTKKIYSSTPYPDKKNSRSEGNLSLYGNTSRSFIPKHDFRDRKYFRKPKALSSDLFLKPLPAEDYFKKAFVRRYYDVESYHPYNSIDSLPQYFEYFGENKALGKNAKSDIDKLDVLSFVSDTQASESKTSNKAEGTETTDKQSTSSESTKDIKIYQSGGIIIMQNFSENTDLIEKKDFSGGGKLIEQCSKLAEKVENSLHSSDESQRLLLNSSSDEVKEQAGKFVQFDLGSSENTRSKSYDSLSEVPKNDSIQTLNNESYNMKADFSKIKVPQNQDFTSLSTQENDSVFSNLPGMSPTSSTSGKKLEWDSGADVGYLNLDLTKENISTIERIILKGLSDDGVSNKQVIYQKTDDDPGARPSKFILERITSELEIEGVHQNDCNKGDRYSNGSSSASKPSKSNTGSSQSGKGIVTTSKKCQNMKTVNKTEEKLEISSKDKNNKSKYYSESSKSGENCRFRKTCRSEKFSDHSEGPVEMPSGAATADIEGKFFEKKNTEKFEEIPAVSDKSTYVNTLYSDLCFDLPLDSISVSGESGRSDSSEKCRPYHGESARTKKYKKKRNNGQETNLTGRLKDKIDKIIDIARQSKKSYAKNKILNNFESRPKTDELDFQCMKGAEPKAIKSDPPSLSSLRKSVDSNSKEKFIGSRPISASSNSVRTEKPNAGTSKENTDVSSKQKNFADQTVQTNELFYESKSIQAFQSAKCSTTSSGVEEMSERKIDEISRGFSGVREVKDVDCNKLLLSRSKSIQAPGMNSSLPKHLAHPKQGDVVDRLNTKSTQFFGGPVTSLPNYHSNVAKEPEKVRMSKSKFISDENSRIELENMKNASLKKTLERGTVGETMLNSESKSAAEDILHYNVKKSNKKTKKNKNNLENKENFLANEEELTDYSKKTEELSEKGSKESCNLVNGSKKSDSLIFGSCDVQLSDDGKNIFLTSDLLKEHGNSIDRNIIQEKYFQSQLLELGGRPMISRSTSMEKKRESERDTQTSFSGKSGVSVSCQCSSNAVSKSGGLIQYPEMSTESGREEIQPKDAWAAGECVSKCNVNKENKFQTLGSSMEDKDFPLADSLSSSTQTAHSWVPGVQQLCENQNFAVGRALSFEYLPGHIYENPENLIGKSLTTAKQRVLHVNSVQSESDSAAELTGHVKESESVHTLVLENTDRSPLGSDQMKNLDNNLTELDMVVTRLHEKEALFQRIADSVLNTVSKTNGSGDSSHSSERESLSNNNSQATEHITCDIELEEESSKSNGSKPEVNLKSIDTKEISTACQTDAMESDSNQFFEEKKKFEKKMNDEKGQQIKWIENEIKHLNMLRSLLEKQDDSKNSVQRKKRHHYLTEAKEGLSSASLGRDIVRDILRDSLPKTESSVHDSTAEDELKLKTTVPLKLTEDSSESVRKFSDTVKSYAPFGMALSLSRANNVQEITMLPVGVQVTLRSRKTSERRGSSLENKSDFIDLEDKSNQNPTVNSLDYVGQNDVGVQHPSLTNRLSSSNLSNKNSDSRRCRCFKCNRSKCVCLKSDSMDGKKSFQDRSQQDNRYEEHSTKPVEASSTITSGEFSKSDVKIPEIRDIDNSRGVSTIGTSTPQVSRSRESSKQERYYNSSEGSVPFEKCVCLCHAEPLPRCASCNLLNTCKKCQCYKRIRCCICKITASRGSLKRTCATVSSSCLCNNDFCQMCQCSRVKNQICSICPCHARLFETVCKCTKKYEERSCQTEGKECKCCKCNEKPEEESDYYRKTKYMVEEQHVSENREPSEVICPSEQKYETEERKPMDEKFSFQMKVPLEKKNHAEVKNPTQLKSELEKRCACEMQPVGVKELKGKLQCQCQSRNANRRSVEEHPRHYFLQVEETTEEESSESGDNRNSLEIITIKVPIRKLCKVNRNSSSSPQRNLRKPISNKEKGDVIANESRYLDQNSETPEDCKCCEDCLGRSHKCFIERPRATDDSCCAHKTQYGDSKRLQRSQEPLKCKCCEDCPGRQTLKVDEKKHFEYAVCDDYERQKFNNISYTKPQEDAIQENPCDYENYVSRNSSQSLKYPENEYGYEEEGTLECQCCNDCPGRIGEEMKSQMPQSRMFPAYPDTYKEDGLEQRSEVPEFSSKTEKYRNIKPLEEKNYESHNRKCKINKYNTESLQKFSRKSPSPKSHQSQRGLKLKSCKSPEKDKDKNKDSEYYNFNKREYLTKSELEREEKKKNPTRLTLQECLTVKRPDLYTRAECRRKIISEKSKDRAERRNKRLECLSKCLPQCEKPGIDADLKLFTGAEMRKQTKKFYRKLPEVTNKIAEEKKKMQFQTNKLMAEIFAKKLQLQTLKGCLNLSNSFSVLSTM